MERGWQVLESCLSVSSSEHTSTLKRMESLSLVIVLLGVATVAMLELETS